MNLTRIGRYEIERELGRGAMAIVYKATDPLIGRIVAIKTIRMEQGVGMEQEELRLRLQREARSAGGMNHPGIVTIYDIGQEGDIAYIAMEFVDGETLENWMAQHPSPPLDQTLTIMEQIAAGLDYAAERGIIHRDIKPGNVLITPDLKAKIADFGIAKISMTKMTQTGLIMGTPSYMSPEQAMGGELDGRSDLFSLGVIFYEMLTGERPFTGTNPTTIIYKILHVEPVPPRQLNVTLHPGLDYIVCRMLEKDPARRYQTCAEFIQDLKNYLALPPAPVTEVSPEALPTKPRRHYGLASVVGILMLAALGGAFYYYKWLPERTAPSVPGTVPAAAGAAKKVSPLQGPAGKTPAAPSGQAVTTEDNAKMATLPPARETAPGAGATAEAARPAAENATKSEPATKEAELTKSEPVKKPEPPPKPKPATIRVEYSGPAYPVILFDGKRKLKQFDASGSLQLPAGSHNLRVTSEEVFLDRNLNRRLEPEESFAIDIPGLGSAVLSVPNDAYEGCRILLNNIPLPTPYPAPVPKLAAGEHKLQFRWDSGKYAGKEVSSVVTIEEGHHYLITADPESGKVDVQMAR